jgi:hypothetical protein
MLMECRYDADFRMATCAAIQHVRPIRLSIEKSCEQALEVWVCDQLTFRVRFRRSYYGLG